MFISSSHRKNKANSNPFKSDFKAKQTQFKTHRPGKLALSSPRLLDYVPRTEFQMAKIFGIKYMKLQRNI